MLYRAKVQWVKTLDFEHPFLRHLKTRKRHILPSHLFADGQKRNMEKATDKTLNIISSLSLSFRLSLFPCVQVRQIIPRLSDIGSRIRIHLINSNLLIFERAIGADPNERKTFAYTEGFRGYQ